MTTNVCVCVLGGGMVTRVRVEQIDSRPLSTSSRHAASIIVRRQEHFEASWSSGGPTGQADGHVTRLLQLATTNKRATRSPGDENAPPSQGCRQHTDQTSRFLH